MAYFQLPLVEEEEKLHSAVLESAAKLDTDHESVVRSRHESN